MARPPQPTPAERAASKKQDDSLRKAKVTPAEGRVINSANRSEASGVKPMKKMAKGGSFRASANGIAKKGKTKAKMVKMAMGGVAGRPETTGKPAQTGLDRAAAMSGRTMPTTGRPAMRKGGMAKKGCK